MAEPTITVREFNIPDDTTGTQIAVEYGCRYPDGHHEWRVFTAYNSVRYTYSGILNDIGSGAAEAWRKTLNKRAEEASIDPEKYFKDHKLVKRTVVLVTTAPEGV